MPDHNKVTVYLRADGNSAIGLGHVFRLLALADMLKGEFNCIFVINRPDETLLQQIKVYCDKVVVLTAANHDEELMLLRQKVSHDSIFVLDGYIFSDIYLSQVKSMVRKLVVVDDLADRFFNADLVINHGNNLRDRYRAASYTKIICGLDYLLLRSNFLELARQPRSVESISCLFICFGGSDPFNLTYRTVEAVLTVAFIQKIIVVTGPSYQYHRDTMSTLSNLREKNIEYYNNVTPEVLIGLALQSELAITPSSTIALELCCIKVGLLTGWFVDNQVHIHDELINKKCAYSAGNFNEISTNVLQRCLVQMNDVRLVNDIMQNQNKVIDGYSSKRILSEFKNLMHDQT